MATVLSKTNSFLLLQFRRPKVDFNNDITNSYLSDRMSKASMAGNQNNITLSTFNAYGVPLNHSTNITKEPQTGED